MDFTDILKERKQMTCGGNRQIAATTLKTYNSVLRVIYKNLWPDDTEINMDRFKETDKVMEYLAPMAVGSRKQKLCALIAVEPHPVYKEQILKDGAEHMRIVKSAEMTEKLEKSSLTDAEVEKARKNLEFIYKNTMRIKDKSLFSINNLMDIENWVLFNLYFGEGMYPRRSMDYYEMKYKNYDRNVDNCYIPKESVFVFNKYKTSFAHGCQTMRIPDEMNKLLKKWIKIIPDQVDYLLFNHNFDKFQSVSMCHRWNFIFGSKKSINSIRHYFLTKGYQNIVEEYRELENTMTQMGSNISERDYYIKRPNNSNA